MGRQMLAGGWLLALTAVMATGPTPAGAALLTVTDCGDTTPGGTAGQLRRLITDAAAGDIIVIPACTINLTGAKDDDANVSGDLDVTKSLILLGAGAGRTVLDGGRHDRVLDINPGGLPDVTVTIADVTIRGGVGNSSIPPRAGGIRNAGTLTLLNSTVAGNSAALPLGCGSGLQDGLVNGAGIYSTGTLVVAGSTIQSNTCDGIVNDGGTLLVARSTAADNIEYAIANVNGGTGAIVDTTLDARLSSNIRLRFTHGIGLQSGNVLVTHSTIGGTSDTGGILRFGGTLTVESTIIDNDCVGGIPTGSRHSLDAGTSCGLTGPGDLSGVDPQLGPLRDNGGPTATFALLAGSPAIDAGDPEGCRATDQRGVARPQDGDLSGAAACDIGAVEARPRLVATGTGVGGGPHVRGFHPGTGAEVFGFFPFDPGFLGGVRVAVGDVTGDGVPDVVTAAGVGGGPHVRVFDGAALLAGQAVEVTSFFAYAGGFAGGVFVAVADVDGDGRADIITGTGPGGGPHVRVFDGTTGAPLAGPIASFFPYDPGFTGGAFVAGAP
jgi:hypothetical protein